MIGSETILHLDGDDFFASLARLRHPRLASRPVVVGNLQSRGIVVAASYEARSAGVSPGITMPQAERLCPTAALVQVDWNLVRRASLAILDRLSRYSPLLERAGVDAMFMDYSGCERLFGAPLDFARRLQRELRDDLKLSVSVGVASDKAVSHVACRAAKLGHLLRVAPGEERIFLEQCPVEWLPGMDGRFRERLRALSVRSIGQLAAIPPALLTHVFGPRGEVLVRQARGDEHAKVRPFHPPVDPEVTVALPSDLLDTGRILAQLALMDGDLGAELRARSRSARRIVLRILYSDSVPAQRQIRLDPPTHRDPEIYRAARDMFDALYTRRVRLRALTLSAGYLTYCPPELPFGDAARRRRWDGALAAADRIRCRFPDLPRAISIAAAAPRVHHA